MLVILTVKDTDNIIGLKEDIAMHLEETFGIEIDRIDIKDE